MDRPFLKEAARALLRATRGLRPREAAIARRGVALVKRVGPQISAWGNPFDLAPVGTWPPALLEKGKCCA